MLASLAPDSQDAGPDTLDRLKHLVAERGLGDLAKHLSDLRDLVRLDMEQLERELADVATGASAAQRSGRHLLDLGGKHLRPLCVGLAARVGNGWSESVLQLAVSAELIHCATLLHDDVIDLADTRRGQPSARLELGNAASIFGGDWLLIEALRRVTTYGTPEIVQDLLATIFTMIEAESLQLENRGRVDLGRDLYFRIARGKSASLFRWAMMAGGTSGGLDPQQCKALQDFGEHLGIAFQIVDDLLDLCGDAKVTGKELFTDLREGKVTYPVILALEAEPELGQPLQLIAEGEGLEGDAAQEILDALERHRVAETSRALAGELVGKATQALELLPKNEATGALAMVAESTINRQR